MKYVTTVAIKGGLSKLDPSEISRSVEDMLERIGVVATKKMKTYTTKHDYRGDLTKSITWRTAFNHGSIENVNDLIDAPPVNCVDIGSANDHAIYREKGTGPHLNPEGSVEFIEEIKLWAASKGLSEDIAWAIIKTIRNEGTDAKPFALPVHYQLESMAMPIIKKAIKDFWASRNKK